MKGKKTGGRKKGTPNKITTTTRGTLAQFLHEYECNKLAKDFAELEPKERIMMFEKMLAYVMPKVQSADEVEGVCYAKEDVVETALGEKGYGKVISWRDKEAKRIASERDRRKMLHIQEREWCLGACGECVIGDECEQRRMLNGIVAEEDCWADEGRLWRGCGDCAMKKECRFFSEYGDFAPYIGEKLYDDEDDEDNDNGEDNGEGEDE